MSQSAVQRAHADPAAEWAELADTYDAPWVDALLIALNVHGLASAASNEPGSRVRLKLRIPGDQFPRLLVVPSGQLDSPFVVHGSHLLLGDKPVALVRRVEADDAVSAYLRCWDGTAWRAATINPNSRSRCTGCVFCPTSLEPAVDPRIRLDHELEQLLAGLSVELAAWGGSLADLDEIMVSTGCFHTEAAALEHLRTFRRVLSQLNIHPRIGLLTSVLGTDTAFAQLRDEVGRFLLVLTAECVSHRDLLLKRTKAELSPHDMPALLARARNVGLDTSFTYIAGLDPLGAASQFCAELLETCTVFPSIATLQCHTPLTRSWRTDGANTLAYYLALRSNVENVAEPLGLTPQPWRCYRSLWYSSFAGRTLTAPVR